MAWYICPSCGQRFNGKKCRNCLYETYDDEIARSLHAHQEANVMDIPASRPVRQTAPVTRPPQVQQEWERQKREFKRKQEARRGKGKRRGFPKWLIWILIFSLVEPAFALVQTIVDEVSDVASDFQREPEPDAALPEAAKVLFSTDGFTLYLAESEDPLRYPLFLENTTDLDVRLSARSVAVDGFLSEQSHAWCESPKDSLREGELWLDEEDMTWADIDAPGRIQVTFAIYETEDYEDILETEVTIDLGETAKSQPPEGQILLDTDTVQIAYLGYTPNENDPEAFYQGTMVFSLENKTGEEISVYTEEARIGGEEVFLSIWSELPGNTWTVNRVWLYLLEDLGIETKAQAGTLELHLMAYTPSGSVDLGWITVNP